MEPSTSASGASLYGVERAQEQLLVQKYGELKLKPRFLGKRGNKKYFDSGDYNLWKQGKQLVDSLLDYDAPIDSLPVKCEPTRPSPRQRTNLDSVDWPDQVDAVPTTVTVLDY